MPDKFITIREIATTLNIDKSTARKYILNQGFSFLKVRTQDSKGQLILALTVEDAESIFEIRKTNGFISNQKSGIPVDDGKGFFYVVQLIPDFMPNRVKLGFATIVENRLKAHRTTSPSAKIIKTWESKKDWEKSVIASITRIDSQIVGGEVFDCKNLDELITRTDLFFSKMPKL